MPFTFKMSSFGHCIVHMSFWNQRWGWQGKSQNNYLFCQMMPFTLQSGSLCQSIYSGFHFNCLHFCRYPCRVWHGLELSDSFPPSSSEPRICFANSCACCRHHAHTLFSCLLPHSEMRWQRSLTRWAWAVNRQETPPSRPLAPCTPRRSCSSLPSSRVTSWPPRASSFPLGASRARGHPCPSRCCSHHRHPRASCSSHRHLLR